jgi:hypothetical protein
MQFDWNAFFQSPVSWILSMILALLLVGGCSDPAQSQTAMDFLRQGQAQGEITLTSGGSPAQFFQKSAWGFGPENAALTFNGRIDYSEADGNIRVFDVQAAKGGDPNPTPPE